MQKEVGSLPADMHDPTVTGILQQVIVNRLKNVRRDMDKLTRPATGGFEAKPIGPPVPPEPKPGTSYQA